MHTFDTRGYGSRIEPFLEGDRLCELGPGTPDRSLRGRLQSLGVEDLFEGRPIRDADMARACLAGLWLLHDFLEESHRISQQIDSPTGSYWHGIMHRREPDYSNAKYWFRRVGTHPVYAAVCEAARELAAGASPDRDAEFLVDQPHWDAARFVDLCGDVSRGRSASESLCRRVARAEWELLFDFSYRQALGDPRG